MQTQRMALDTAVHGVLLRARRDLAAPEVADRSGYSLMQVTYALKRLCARGQAYGHVEIVDTPGRYNSTVVVYRVCRQASGLWPSWLQPRAVPAGWEARKVWLLDGRG